MRRMLMVLMLAAVLGGCVLIAAEPTQASKHRDACSWALHWQDQLLANIMQAWPALPPRLRHMTYPGTLDVVAATRADWTAFGVWHKRRAYRVAEYLPAHR